MCAHVYSNHSRTASTEEIKFRQFVKKNLNIDDFIGKCYTINRKIRYTRIVTEEGDTWILQNGTSLSGCFCGIQVFIL